MKIYDGTLNTKSVTIDFGENGEIPGLRCYENSPSGRRYLADEAPELADQVFAVWGDAPVLEDPVIGCAPQEPANPAVPLTQQITDMQLALADIYEQTDRQNTEVMLALAEVYETMLNTASTEGR